MSKKPAIPTFEEDLDQVMRLGFGRRFLARLVAGGMRDTAYNADTNATYFNLGLSSRARALDQTMRQVNPDAWLLLHGEMIKAEQDEEETAKAEA